MTAERAWPRWRFWLWKRLPIARRRAKWNNSRSGTISAHDVARGIRHIRGEDECRP